MRATLAENTKAKSDTIAYIPWFSCLLNSTSGQFGTIYIFKQAEITTYLTKTIAKNS